MTTVLLYALGILIMLLGLAISIALHEIGHLVPAKLFGVRVTQYMIGFGRTIWSRKKGETEYGVKMLPLGGYISMIGMYPPARPGEAARDSTTGFLNSVAEAPARKQRANGGSEDGGSADGGSSRLAAWAEDAREASAETIPEGEDRRSFYRLSPWKRIIIMLGGPFMNLVLAFVCFAIVISGFGVTQNSMKLSSVSECMIPAASERTECAAGDPAAPAAAAGLKPGDTVLSVNGSAVTDWQEFRGIVSKSPGQQLTLEIERDGSTETVSLTPQRYERVLVTSDGKPQLDDNGEYITESVGVIGASPGIEVSKQPITEVPGFVWKNVQQVAGIVVGLPQRLVDVWNAAFGPEERDPNGPMGVIGVGRLAGEVASLEEVPIASRAQLLVNIMGSLNIALFVFNLIPLLPLDGGHVAGAIYESLKRRWAKLRKKPDPGPVDTAKMVPVTFAVVIVFGAMSLLLMYADIVKPVTLSG